MVRQAKFGVFVIWRPVKLNESQVGMFVRAKSQRLPENNVTERKAMSVPVHGDIGQWTGRRYDAIKEANSSMK